MYARVNKEIYQGDILKSYHFLLPPLGLPYAYLEKGKDPEPVNKIIAAEGKTIQIIANTIFTDAIIITQTCDAQRREFISVCPIFSLNQMQTELAVKWGDQRIKSFIEELRIQKINYYLYLPAIKMDNINLPESYVDLQVINSLPLQNIGNYNRTITLSDKGRHWLAYKLANLFYRPA